MKRLNQDGVAHLLIIVIVALAIVGGAGYLVMSKQKDSGTAKQSAAGRKAAEAECKKQIDDKDFCKFVSNINFDQPYKSVMTTKGIGGSVLTLNVDGKNSSMVSEENGKEMSATVSIDGVTYIKDYSDGKWTKYPAPEKANDSDEQVETTEDRVTVDESDFAEDKTTYKEIGKEACGSLTCFKYEITDKDEPENKQIIWFDDKEYKIRKYTGNNIDQTYEIIYSYEKVNIKAPSPVKEAPNYENMSEAELKAELDKAMQQYEQ